MPFPGNRKRCYSDKTLADAQKKIEKKSARARKKGLDYFLRSINNHKPNTIKYATKGIWECLFDKDPEIVNKACRLIVSGTKSKPQLFIIFVPALVEQLERMRGDNLRNVTKALVSIGQSMENGSKKVFNTLRRFRPRDMDWEGDIAHDCNKLLWTNPILKELGCHNKKNSSVALSMTMKGIKYPIYQPGRANSTVENLYKKSLNEINSLCSFNPKLSKKTIPIILKVLGDTLTFNRWLKEKDETLGMHSTFKRAFRHITRVGGKHVVLPMLQGLSTSNDKTVNMIRERFLELGAKSNELLPPLLNCLGHKSSEVQKHSHNVLSGIIELRPKENATIILKHILKSHDIKIKTGGTILLGVLVESTGIHVGKRVKPMLEFYQEDKPEMARALLNLLGNMGVYDKKILPAATKFQLKGLGHPEHGVRLIALSALEKLVARYKEIMDLIVPGIMQLQNDPVDTVRWRSRNILKNLGLAQSDINDYLVSKKRISKTKILMEQLKKGGNLHLTVLETELKKARLYWKKKDFRRTSIYSKNALNIALAMRPKNPPKLDVSIKMDKGFTANEQNIFSIEIRNIGGLHAHNISLNFNQNVELITGLPKSVLAGDSCTAQLGWTPHEDGRVPFGMSMSFEDFAKYRITSENKKWLDVKPGKAQKTGKYGKEDSLNLDGANYRERDGGEGTTEVEIEDMYLIHRKTGTLVQRRTWRAADLVDPDVMSGMFRAILDFVDQSFVSGERGAFSRIYVKGYIILIYDAEHLSIAMVFSGDAEALLHQFGDAIKTVIHQTAMELESDFTDTLSQYKGNTATLRRTRRYMDHLATEINSMIVRTKKVKTDIALDDMDVEDIPPPPPDLSTTYGVEMQVKNGQEHLNIYLDSLRAALKDNVITPDEDNMLRQLRGRFNITPEQHQRLLNRVQSENYTRG